MDKPFIRAADVVVAGLARICAGATTAIEAARSP